MNKLMLAAGFAALAFAAGTARAEDTVESLRQPVIDVCKTQMGSEEVGGDADKVCTCMVDAIIKDFDADAVSMLKILKAGLNPSQVAEIAALLGITEDQAKAFVDMADDKMDAVQESCMPSEAAPGEGAPAEAAPAEPAATEPAPTEPAPTEAAPTP